MRGLFFANQAELTPCELCEEWVPVKLRAPYTTFTKIITSANNTSDSIKARPRISAT